MTLSIQSCTYEGIQVQADVTISQDELLKYTTEIHRALMDKRAIGVLPFRPALYDLTDVEHIEIEEDKATVFLKPGAVAKPVTPFPFPQTPPFGPHSPTD